MLLLDRGHYNLRKLIGGNCADKIKDHSSGMLADDSYHRYKVLYIYTTYFLVREAIFNSEVWVDNKLGNLTGRCGYNEGHRI